MASEVKLPRLGQGMESGTIVKWLKSEGDRVEKGEPLYELDTDKVTQEVEAEAAGVLLRIAVAEGEVPVGETIAVIGEEGEEVSLESSSGNGAAAPEVAEEPQEEGSAGGSKPRRSHAGSRGSAGSTSPPSREPAPKVGSWPRTSSARAPVQLPHKRLRLSRQARSRSRSSPRCGARSRGG